MTNKRQLLLDREDTVQENLLHIRSQPFRYSRDSIAFASALCRNFSLWAFHSRGWPSRYEINPRCMGILKHPTRVIQKIAISKMATFGGVQRNRRGSLPHVPVEGSRWCLVIGWPQHGRKAFFPKPNGVHFANGPALNQLDYPVVVIARVNLGAQLKNPVVPIDGLQHFLPFPNAVRERFLAVHVFPCLKRHDCDLGMPMVVT